MSDPVNGTPCAWVGEHVTGKLLKFFTGENAEHEAVEFIDQQPADRVSNGDYYLDYGEYRECCGEFMSPEADCEHQEE